MSVPFNRQKTINAVAEKTAGRVNSQLRLALKNAGVKTDEEIQMFFSTYLRKLKPVQELVR